MRGPKRLFAGKSTPMLHEGPMGGPMPWVIAIMIFLAVFAAAAGLGLAGAAQRLESQLGHRITIQVVEADPGMREAQARIVEARLKTLPGIRNVRRVPDAELRDLLEPWFGTGGMGQDLPIPALIDADLSPEARVRIDALQASLAAVAPAARIDDHAQWFSPLAGLIAAFQWLAIGLVLLMIFATAATVVIAARAGFDTHRETIEILHLMGATDAQVARIFQRRIALDTLFGGLAGFLVAGLVLAGISDLVGELGSDLLGAAGRPSIPWGILILLPISGVMLAVLVARVTVLRSMGRML